MADLIKSSVVLLLADTMRSRAYAQALENSGLSVSGVMVIRSPENRRWGQADVVKMGGKGPEGLFIPDLNISLERTINDLTDDITLSNAGTLNGEQVMQWLHARRPRLVVFSGFGSEIVSKELLQTGYPFLHLHSGWLPDYRGSTTIYYSYLAEGYCGVSALFMDEDIDTGPIVKRKAYPPPPPHIDVDYCYDSTIRADLLVEVLNDWRCAGGVLPTMEQPEGGRSYYIIHPVLKHIALQRINAVEHE